MNGDTNYIRCGLASLLLAGTVAAGAKLPNIVILYADDLGYGDLSIQNPDGKIPTPHLDQLAREGTRFTDAHSSSGICTPSRYALLTGRYHWRKFHGIVGSFGPPVIENQRLTLAEVLRERGYHTACIGKWHLGWDWQAIRQRDATPRVGARGNHGLRPEDFDWSQSITGGPLTHGFDHYFGDDVPNFPPYTWIENDHVVIRPTTSLRENPPTAEGQWEARPGPMAEGWRLDAVMPTLTERAVSWIRQRRTESQPFFLYFAFTSPHAPIVPVAEFAGQSQAGGYGDYVVQTDASVGRVLQALDENGFRENTLVLFSSDNGPEQYAYERVRRYRHRSAGPLRGVKRDLWEGGHRVPFLARWPGRVPVGRVCHGLISQIDVMATLAAVVEYNLPDSAADDSLNQLALLTGTGESARTSLVHNTHADHYAIREGPWLLINAKSGDVTRVPAWYYESEGFQENRQEMALYDLTSDVGQRDNVCRQYPERAERMRKLLEQKLVDEHGERWEATRPSHSALK